MKINILRLYVARKNNFHRNVFIFHNLQVKYIFSGLRKSKHSEQILRYLDLGILHMKTRKNVYLNSRVQITTLSIKKSTIYSKHFKMF